MDRKKLFKSVVALALLMWFLDILSKKFYWYYSIWWFDMPVHFLGGFWVGMFFVWYFSIVAIPFARRKMEDFSSKNILTAMLFVFFIGIAWEAGEFLTNNYIGLEPWISLDTFSDIFFDLAGGALALAYSRYKTMPYYLLKVQSN